MTKSIPITDIHVGQFLLSRKKLRGALDGFSQDGLRPFTYRMHRGSPTLTDGHHTAFVAFLHGVKEIEIIFDNDDYDWDEWDKSTEETWRRGGHRLSDFVGRVVDHEEYIEKWVGFCQTLNK